MLAVDYAPAAIMQLGQQGHEQEVHVKTVLFRTFINKLPPPLLAAGIVFTCIVQNYDRML